MNKMFNKIISAMLVVAVVFSCVSVSVLSTEALAYDSTSEYKTGDIIVFGSYPKSEVTDKTLIAELNSQARCWESYSYYRGTGSPGSMVTDGYMTYSDVSYGGNKYRGVSFDRYRPPYTDQPFNDDDSYQKTYGYYRNGVFWFKYEPLKWRVIDAEKCLVMSEEVIDSQAYSNTMYRKITDGSYEYYNDSSNTKYANDYATSTIRKWLNDDFYNTAFTSSEKAEIGITTLDNSCYKSSCPEFDSEITHDKIFLLSYDEAKKLSFNNLCYLSPSGYALCQGLYIGDVESPDSDFPVWLLRSSGGDSSANVCFVYYDGDIKNDGSVDFTGYGIRPAFRFDRKTPDIRLGNAEAVLSFDDITRIFASENADKICVYPTAKSGEKVTIETAGTPIKVSSSGTYYLKYDAWHEAGCDVKTTMKIGDEEYTVSFVFTTVTHSYGEWEITALPTCTETGLQSKVCSICGNVETEDIPPTFKHTEGEWTVAKAATWFENGQEEIRCTVCNQVIRKRVIPATREALLGYSAGEIIEIGTYPQSKVTDAELIQVLEDQKQLSGKYEYYAKIETGKYYYYMDITYSGERYRSFRWSTESSVTWYKYEPLKWRILDPNEGLVISESIIDFRRFGEYVYPSDMWYWEIEDIYDPNCYVDAEIYQWIRRDFDENAGLPSNCVPDIPSQNIITEQEFGFVMIDENTYDGLYVEVSDYARGLGASREWWLSTPDEETSEDKSVFCVRGEGTYGIIDGNFVGDLLGVRPIMKVSYVEHDDIRLLDSKAYVFDKEVKIYGVEDAEKICVYPTAKSGEKVTIETAGTPIKVSSSGTYYLKYDAWHEAGCDVKTTMKIGDEEYTVSFVFTTVNHTEVDSPAVAPTCTETGLTAGTHCEICKNPIEKQQEIPALGHSYGEWETTTLPTCTEIGVDSKICSVCGNVATKEIPALGHKEGEWTVVKPATKLERGEEELRCTVCTEILETREIPSIAETLVSDEELMAIRGVVETKAYKDEDYIALVKRSGATSVGVYKETIDGYSVEITMQYGKINDTGTYYVAYESQNKTNPAGIMKVTYPDGTVKQSRVVFELYDIDMEVDINPAESVKPIRGKVSLQNDVAGDYILVQMSEGQTSVGMYKESLDETVLTLIETSGVVQEKDNWFISYGSQNTKNPEGRLHVVKSDGSEATYRIVFRLFETDPGASLLKSLKAIRGTVTVENDGTEDYIRVKRSAGKTSVGLYKSTTAGIEYEITDSTGILQNKSSMYIAYRSQNEGDITGKINFKMPDGTIQTYKIIFSF